MNILDSSAWLECFGGTGYAPHFFEVLDKPETILVPSIVLYEVFKRVIVERGEEDALSIAPQFQHRTIIELTIELALWAAKISKREKLAMADSIILATARKYDATIWTLDKDFEGMEKVKYFKK